MTIHASTVRAISIWRSAIDDSVDDETEIEPGEETEEILETVVEALPRFGIAVAVLVVTYVLVKLVEKFLKPRLAARRTESFGRVISRLIGWAIGIFGFFIACVVLFPSIKPVSIISGLGIFSIAIGFAFQDILSNLLAGILLLIRQPFESGDQIEVSGQKGTVQAITIRETQIKTFDGEKVIIPNAEVYQNVIRVQTAYGPKRSTLMIGLEDWEDLDAAAEVALAAIRDIEGVEADPAPEAFFFEFGDSTTNFDLRFWTQPQQHTVREVTDRVVRSVGRALKESGIPMPSPIREMDARTSVGELVQDSGGGRDAADSADDSA